MRKNFACAALAVPPRLNERHAHSDHPLFALVLLCRGGMSAFPRRGSPRNRGDRSGRAKGAGSSPRSGWRSLGGGWRRCACSSSRGRPRLSAWWWNARSFSGGCARPWRTLCRLRCSNQPFLCVRRRRGESVVVPFTFTHTCSGTSRFERRAEPQPSARAFVALFCVPAAMAAAVGCVDRCVCAI